MKKLTRKAGTKLKSVGKTFAFALLAILVMAIGFGIAFPFKTVGDLREMWRERHNHLSSKR